LSRTFNERYALHYGHARRMGSVVTIYDRPVPWCYDVAVIANRSVMSPDQSGTCKS
jgi:hypothetical protein